MRVWHVKFVQGDRVLCDEQGPFTRRCALRVADAVDKNGWRVWVEHFASGRRIHSGKAELAFQQKRQPVCK